MIIRSIDDNYILIKLIAREFVIRGLNEERELFFKCIDEGMTLYGQSDVSRESVVSTIKEKYLEFNS